MRENDTVRIDRNLLQRLIGLIAKRTGLSIRPQDWERLREKVTDRILELQLTTAQEYYYLLAAVQTRPSRLEVYRSEQEWKTLMNVLTVTESYFFRDVGQFNLLRSTILPQIIDRKKQEQVRAFSGNKPTLKIWSAACASGEEPYSIAILLKELMPDLEDWQISIFGTDINEDALERAKQGLYSDWSFRPMELSLKQRYFQAWGQQWRLSQGIRDLVKFDRLNLVIDSFPNPWKQLDHIDLILCRNVFIYFERSVIADVLNKFYQTLGAGGYLMAAHGELQGQPLGHFQTHSFCQSVVYQRRNDDQSHRSPTRQTLDNKGEATPTPLTDPSGERILTQRSRRYPEPVVKRDPEAHVSPSSSCEIDSLFAEVMMLFQKRLYLESIEVLEKLLTLHPECLDYYAWMAESYARLGDWQKANYYCTQALEIDPLNLETYYLLAEIAEFQGNFSKAKILLKKIIYLDPKSRTAYLELSALYHKEGKIEKSKKMKQNAIDLLQTLPAVPISQSNRGFSARQFRRSHA